MQRTRPKKMPLQRPLTYQKWKESWDCMQLSKQGSDAALRSSCSTAPTPCCTASSLSSSLLRSPPLIPPLGAAPARLDEPRGCRSTGARQINRTGDPAGGTHKGHPPPAARTCQPALARACRTAGGSQPQHSIDTVRVTYECQDECTAGPLLECGRGPRTWRARRAARRRCRLPE